MGAAQNISTDFLTSSKRRLLGGNLPSKPYSKTAQPMAESWRMVQVLSSMERMGKEFVHVGIHKPSPNELRTSRWSLIEFGLSTVTLSPYYQNLETMREQYSLSILPTQRGGNEQAQGSIHRMRLTMPVSFQCVNSFVATSC